MAHSITTNAVMGGERILTREVVEYDIEEACTTIIDTVSAGRLRSSQ